MNKFKVGDKVRLVKVDDEILDEYKDCLGKIFKIIEISYPESSYAYARLEGTRIMPYIENLEFVKDNYTYEDLKKCPIGTKITFEKGIILVKTTEKRLECGLRFTSIENLKKLKDEYYGTIIKIEEPTYQTVYEANPEILDETEKRYLRGVIRPFRDRIKYICKLISAFGKYEYIEVDLGNDTLVFPNFKPNTMYKRMKVDKKYTLEELGL